MCREENGASEVDNIHDSVRVTKELENETAKLSHTENQVFQNKFISANLTSGQIIPYFLSSLKGQAFSGGHH
jgi:hypothetical protein